MYVMHLRECSCTPWARPSPAPLSATTWPAGTTHCGHCRLVPSKLLHGGWPGVGGRVYGREGACGISVCVYALEGSLCVCMCVPGEL